MGVWTVFRGMDDGVHKSADVVGFHGTDDPTVFDILDDVLDWGKGGF
jgi:hypothetical protein